MEIMDKQQVTLSRIQFIADVSQAAQCSASEFLIAMSLISDLASQVLPNNDYQEIFYPADEHPPANPSSQTFFIPAAGGVFISAGGTFAPQLCHLIHNPLALPLPPTRAKLKISGATALSPNAIAGW